jgi:gliding motility-associated-like protein
MKLLALISLVVFPSILFAQGATCADMDPICTDVGASFTANTGTTSQAGNNYGCLSTQPNPSWYYFEVATNGNIDMSLTAGSDIDFIIWGPFANLASAQANCGSLGASVDCSYSSTNNETPSIPGAVAGQVYIMLITNYASVVQNITLTQTGGAGSTDCNIVNNPPCFMSYFQATVGACDPLTGTYSVTGSIEFDDPPVSGNLIVQDCDGNQTIVASAPFTVNASGGGVENFTLPGLDPDAGPCSVTAFFSADPTCTQVLNYTAPECICNFSYMSVSISPCDDADATFDITGFVEFESQPTTGTMTVSDCNGNSQVFNPPFVSPLNFQLLNIPSDGTTNCAVTATFSADPTCTITSPSFNYPACIVGINCPVDIGSFTTSINGSTDNPAQLCFGDSFVITPNGDFIPPDDIGDDGTFTYNPGMWIMIYSCPPTLLAPDDLLSDPCFLGSWEVDDPAGPWSIDNVYGDNSTYYFVPVTFYDYVEGIFSYFTAGTLCYDMGPAYPITFLSPIQGSFVEDCFAGTSTATVYGSSPEFNGSFFTVVPGSLTPSTASFVNTSAPNNGTITVTGLLDGDAYSYEIQDENGCPVAVSAIFSGMQDANFTYNFKYCQDEPDPVATITGVAGGDFTATPAGIVFLNPTTGLIDLSASTPGTYTVQYESPAATCWGTETFVLTINPLPLVNATEDSPICDDGVSTIQLDETGGQATEWLWSSNGSATITNPTDQNPIVSNDAVNGEIFTVQVTNINTGCTNSDQVTVTVNPINTIATGPNRIVCINSAMANISLATTGATGATFTGLPAGVTGAWSANVATISGTPTASGTFNYTVTTTGGCPPATATGTITVTPLNTIAAGTSQTVCMNSAISNITLATTGATGATFTGLPAGVTGSWSGNVATISGTSTASGTFNYTVTTTGGCPPATTTGTITVTALNTIAAGTNQTVCINSAITNINLSTTGATGATFVGLPSGVTGAWAGNVATISGTPTASGTFNYTVTTTGGCPPATTTGTITVTPLNTIAAGTNQTVCINSAITNITLATTGATGATFTGLPAGVTGAWSGNVVTISGTPTASGTFNYTVTTTGGCPPATTTGTITVTPLNTIAVGTSQTVCVNSAIANITLATTGATGATFTGLPAGVTGAWAGNVATISGTPTASGTFNYSVTTTGGCPPATTTGTITVTPLNTIGAGTNQTVCTNTAMTDITLATTGATGATFTGLPAGVTGAWSGNVATISGTPTAAGTYNYTVTTTGGCPPATATGVITVSTSSTIAAGTNQTICINSAITNIILATGGATGATFTGLPVGVTGVWSGNVVTISGTPSASGIFNYTVTTTGICLPATATGTITVTPSNTIAAGTNQTVCINSAITNITLATTGATGATFTGLPAGVTGAWAGNVATISGTPTASGTFNYTVTTAGGCPPATTTGTITVTPLNTIGAGTNQTVCINSAITNITLVTTGATGATFVGLPAGVTGAWAGNVATIIGTPTASGTFNYTVTTTGGCPPATTTGTITVTPVNTIAAGTNQTVCINSAITSITLATTGATGATFTGLPAGVTGAWAGNVATISGTPTASGTFNYSVTTTGGCPPATTTGTITVNPLPTATISGTATICENGMSPDIIFTGANGTEPYTFTYNINGGPNLTVNSIGATANVVVPSNPSGVFTYNLVSVSESSVNNCGQAQVGSAVITINSLPNVNAGIDQVACGNDEITLTASGANSYAWDNGVVNGVAFVPISTTYTVIGTDGNGCTNTDNVSVLVSPVPEPDFNATYNSCEPFIVTLTNTTPGVSAGCTWQVSNGSAPIQGCGPITLTMSQAGSYDVTLTISNLNGCTGSIALVDAFVFEEAPIASFTPYNTTLTTLNTEVHFENGSAGANSYDWTFGDNSPISNVTNPIHVYDDTENGNYLVTLIAYSNAGCSDTAYGYIRVEEEIIYYVPNTFTPDNDSYNQFFQPIFTSGYDPFDYSLLIFDRWGEIIFESHDVTKGWDGTYSDNYKVQDGTYTWKIEFKTTINDKRVSDIGHVNVLR